MIKLGIVTYYNERYRALGDLTSSVMLEYCQTYGYDFICSMDEIAFGDRTPLWAKIPILRDNLPNYDWLMWIDSDAAPINFAHRAADFASEDHAMVIVEENHPDGDAINTGVMWIRNCGESMTLLEETWAQEQCIHHPWGEQQGMIEAIAKKPDFYGPLIKKIPPKPVNVKPSLFTSDDFICHIAGGPAFPEGKARILSEIIEKYKKTI